MAEIITVLEDNMRTMPILFALLLTLVITACSGGAAETAILPVEESSLSLTPTAQQVSESTAEEPVTSEGEVSNDTAVDNTGDSEVDSAVSAVEDAAGEEPAGDAYPAYFSAALVDASTGNSFKIEDFGGKVVLVETLAMWCSNCFRQQNQVKALHEMIGERDDFISLGLDIDPNENITDLKGYVEKNGFHWWYAVAPLDVARELGQLYGAQFLNPPSTPMLIIDRQGNMHPLPFGIKSADQLMESLQPFLAES
jgi:hypothetical protein